MTLSRLARRALFGATLASAAACGLESGGFSPDSLIPGDDAGRDVDRPPPLPDAASDTGCTPTHAQEICNGVDDNCKDGVDEGCPSALALADAEHGPILGNMTNAASFDEPCGGNRVLVGMKGMFRRFVHSVQIECVAIGLTSEKRDDRMQYRVGWSGNPEYLPGIHGGSNNTMNPQGYELHCQPPSVVMGINVRSHPATTFDPPYISRIEFQCAELEVAEREGGAFAVAFKLPLPPVAFVQADVTTGNLEQSLPEGALVFAGLAGQPHAKNDPIQSFRAIRKTPRLSLNPIP